MNMESIYEYGSRSGFWRLHRLFTERDMPVTVFGVATALARIPDTVLAMQQVNWEIATHGLKWIDYKDFTKEQEAEHLVQAIALHEQVTGSKPRGAYIGRTSVNSQDLCADHSHLEYCADTYADELPYWRSSPTGPQLMVPYTLDANDMRFATPQGFNAGNSFTNT
jgi:peptidoglycan/xylan/chitin deacetylase (PgdA/CDA1 family)